MALAEEDFEVAVHLLNLGKFRPSLFHLQQSVEKYLKAFLVLKGIEFERTHDIRRLVELCSQADPEFHYLLDIGAHFLTEYATETRYPGFHQPTKEEAEESFEVARKALEFIKRKINR